MAAIGEGRYIRVLVRIGDGRMAIRIRVLAVCMTIVVSSAAAWAQQAPATLEITRQNGQWRVAGPTLERSSGRTAA